MNNSDIEYPTMECPRCGAEYEDLDGVGVLACVSCQWCSHPCRDGGACNICGHDETHGYPCQHCDHPQHTHPLDEKLAKQYGIYPGECVACSVGDSHIFQHRTWGEALSARERGVA